MSNKERFLRVPLSTDRIAGTGAYLIATDPETDIYGAFPNFSKLIIEGLKDRFSNVDTTDLIQLDRDKDFEGLIEANDRYLKIQQHIDPNSDDGREVRYLQVRDEEVGRPNEVIANPFDGALFIHSSLRKRTISAWTAHITFSGEKPSDLITAAVDGINERVQTEGLGLWRITS